MPSVYFTKDEMCTTQKLEVKRIYDFFVANGYDVVQVPEGADLILSLTCAGWKKLEDNSLEELRSLQRFGDKVVSLGCVNDVSPDAVKKVHSGRIVSARRWEDVEALLPEVKVRFRDLPDPSTFKSKEDYRLYDLTKRFVNICGGCSFNCVYCPHRIGLGPLKSRPLDSIVCQVEVLAQGDLRVLVLTGMETALYGLDIGLTYPDVVKAVLQVKGNFEIHVAQFHPIGAMKYREQLLSLWADPRFSDIQIPLQTTSPRLLRLMRRPDDFQAVSSFLGALRAANPTMVMRTDIIVGFPTETMEELDQTLNFVVNVFDEVAVYGIELRHGIASDELVAQTYSAQEVQRRADYANAYIERHGKMAHKGQQGDESLLDIEERKKKLRAMKRGC